MRLELGRQLARCRQRDADGGSDLAHRLGALCADVGERRDMSAAELRLFGVEREEPKRGAAAPKPPQHLTKGASQLRQFRVWRAGNSYSDLTVIIR